MNYKWQYSSLGGVVRVKISTGEDIAHLGELDEKYWTVLSCPVDGLAMDRQTLSYLDADSDGRIRVKEVVAAAEWLCSCLKDNDLLLGGDSSLSLDAFDDSDAKGPGARLKSSARQILENLGRDGDVISVEDAADTVAIFRGTRFNGDGVITLLTAGEDPGLRDALEACITTLGSVTDRSGEPGVTAETVEKFYALCGEYSRWQASAAGSKAVFPYGDDTAAAYAACLALNGKMEDFFMRCRLLSYDGAAAAALEVKIEKPEDLASCPLARPTASGTLSLKALNPAWEGAVAGLAALVPEKDFAGEDGVTEESWGSFRSGFDSYAAWIGAKKGAEVEPLGLDRINSIIAADRRQDLLALAAEDSAKKEESDSIDEVRKFMHLYRDFGRFLRNYVTFSDFYARPERRAIFEAGRLYVDQRCCDLCIRVNDMAGHNDMARLSGMFLIYCRCTSKVRPETLDIVAVLTAGDTGDLRPGKNGIFYDLQGRDWDATITKVVDNPISISNAFWSPYRKFWDFCVGLISKSAEEKDGKVMKEMQAKAAQTITAKPEAAAAPKEQAGGKQAFDIAKFAGIFAAIGMAIGYIGSFLTKLAAGIAATAWWQLLLAIAALMLIISGPSCFLAWNRLRLRNLGPVLNANGWAMNTRVLVNIVFGNTLTSVARYPKLKMADPYRPKKKAWKWIVPLAVILVLGAAAAVYFLLLK